MYIKGNTGYSRGGTMLKLSRSWKLSVFAKEFIIFIIIVMPLYLFSIGMNINAQNDVRKEQAEALISKIDFYVEMLEREFQNIMSLQARFIGDEDLYQLLITDNLAVSYENARHLNNLRSKLLYMKFQNKYILEGKIYIPGIRRQISDSIIEPLDWERYAQLSKLTTNDHQLTTMIDNNIYISITPNFTLIEKEESYPTYIVSVMISKDEIEQMLKQISMYKEGGALLLGNDFGLNIGWEKDKDLLPHLKRHIDSQDIEFGDTKLDIVKVGLKKYIVVFKKSSQLNTTIISYVPEEEFLQTLGRYKSWIWIITLFTLLFVGIFSFAVHHTISTPLNKLVEAFRVIEKGELDISLDYKSNDEFSYIYQRFNKMCERLKNLIKQVYEEKLYARNAELKQLQYQINPHFLYNSFFLIQRMAYINDCEGIERFTNHLGSYYQFVTRSASDEVPLHKEIEHAKNYVEIQSFRFGDRINVEFENIPTEYKDIKVIRLILQPILENCYNHGLRNVQENGKIKVSFFSDRHIYKIKIEDNGSDIDESKIALLEKTLISTDPNLECTAIINVHRRLRIKYGGGSGVRLFKSELGGLGVEIVFAIVELSE
jgi:two-component system, sensor histidine kinase YesM